jgi:hypothetical protein
MRARVPNFANRKSELFSVHGIVKIKVFWYDDFARLRNFSVVEASGSTRVAIELRIDSGGGSELLAINRQDKPVKSSGSEICDARRARDGVGHERPKRAALPERRESKTCCEAPGRVSAAAVESGVRRTDERF